MKASTDRTIDQIDAEYIDREALTAEKAKVLDSRIYWIKWNHHGLLAARNRLIAVATGACLIQGVFCFWAAHKMAEIEQAPSTGPRTSAR